MGNRKENLKNKIYNTFEIIGGLSILSLIIYFHQTIFIFLLYPFFIILSLLFFGFYLHSMGRVIKEYRGERRSEPNETKIKGKLLNTLFVIFILTNIFTCSYFIVDDEQEIPYLIYKWK